jgi:hypothetical protein
VIAENLYSERCSCCLLAFLASNDQSNRQDSDGQTDSAGKEAQDNEIPPPPPPPFPMDLAEKVKGMYRLLDLISESGSNGCGDEHFLYALLVLTDFCHRS